MGIRDFFRRRKVAPQTADRVSFTDETVTRTRPDGVQQTIRWDDLHEVVIVTTDQGPFQEDVFIFLILADGTSGCTVPHAAEGGDALFARLQKLPGFDHETAVRAMTSTSNAKFPCWKRGVAADSPP
jgi:hypothetical protein